MKCRCKCWYFTVLIGFFYFVWGVLFSGRCVCVLFVCSCAGLGYVVVVCGLIISLVHSVIS